MPKIISLRVDEDNRLIFMTKIFVEKQVCTRQMKKKQPFPTNKGHCLGFLCLWETIIFQEMFLQGNRYDVKFLKKRIINKEAIEI